MEKHKHPLQCIQPVITVRNFLRKLENFIAFKGLNK